jgi:hypothetical protein
LSSHRQKSDGRAEGGGSDETGVRREKDAPAAGSAAFTGGSGDYNSTCGSARDHGAASVLDERGRGLDSYSLLGEDSARNPLDMSGSLLTPRASRGARGDGASAGRRSSRTERATPRKGSRGGGDTPRGGRERPPAQPQRAGDSLRGTPRAPRRDPSPAVARASAGGADERPRGGAGGGGPRTAEALRDMEAQSGAGAQAAGGAAAPSAAGGAERRGERVRGDGTDQAAAEALHRSGGRGGDWGGAGDAGAAEPRPDSAVTPSPPLPPPPAFAPRPPTPRAPRRPARAVHAGCRALTMRARGGTARRQQSTGGLLVRVEERGAPGRAGENGDAGKAAAHEEGAAGASAGDGWDGGSSVEADKAAAGGGGGRRSGRWLEGAGRDGRKTTVGCVNRCVVS